MAKIIQMTEEQAARLPVFREEYLKHGISTAPADRPRAEAAFARAYRAIGKEPVPVIWVSSPLSASLAFAALEHLALRENAAPTGAAFDHSALRAQLGDHLGDQLWAQLGDQLRDQLWDQLGDHLRGQLGDQLWDQLWDQLGDQLWDQLGDQLWDQIRDQIRDQLWDQIRDQLGDQLWDQLRDQLRESLQSAEITFQHTYWWGQQDLYWVALYKFAAEIGVKYDESAADRLDIMHEIGLSCMWWYPRDGLIIACDRPLAVNFDGRGRLHNDNGPAVEFRDGWKLYAVHGVRLPAWIMEEPERVTLAAIDAEENSEIQRVMVERFGWDRYAAECGAEVIDHDDRWGTLFRRKTSAGEPIVYLEVINRSAEPDGTFRHYILPVHPDCCPLPDPEAPRGELGDPQAVTALNAVASTFGMKGAEYRRLVGAES